VALALFSCYSDIENLRHGSEVQVMPDYHQMAHEPEGPDRIQRQALAGPGRGHLLAIRSMISTTYVDDRAARQ
jgi:hypothetical protein